MEASSPDSIRFVFSAKDRDGRPAVVDVMATSARAARHRLEIQGYSELALLGDGTAEAWDQAFGQGILKTFTAEKRLRWQQATTSKHPFFASVWLTVRDQWWIVSLLLAGIVWRATGATPFGLTSLVIYALAGIWLRETLFGGRMLYHLHRIGAASNWCRWDEVARLSRVLRRRWKAVAPDVYLRLEEAKAMAARGDIPGALEHLRPLTDQPTMDEAIYEKLLSSVYGAGRDFQNSVRCLERALELRPDAPTAKIELAFEVARRHRDFARAQALLDELDEEDIPQTEQALANLTRAMIALNRGNPVEAETLLRQAHTATLKSIPDRNRNGVAMYCEAYLAIALRRQDRVTEARELFTQTEEWLRVRSEKEILEEWFAGDPSLTAFAESLIPAPGALGIPAAPIASESPPAVV